MSQNEQEKAAEETGIPAVPGHQGGAAPLSAQKKAGEDATEDAASSVPHKVEPRAGRDS